MATAQRLPIAIIDDQALFRDALAGMIDRFGGYEVAVHAANGQEFVDAMKKGPRVALAIVDLHMPVMDGYATIAWIREHLPGTRALALTFENTETAMIRAMNAGACGFLLKDAHANDFKDALEQVATLGYYRNQQLLESLSVAGETPAAYEAARKDIMTVLTEREVEFLRLVSDVKEYTYDQIADLMQVHRRTVDGYRESIFEKYDIKSKAGLVIFAYKWEIAVKTSVRA